MASEATPCNGLPRTWRTRPRLRRPVRRMQVSLQGNAHGPSKSKLTAMVTALFSHSTPVPSPSVSSSPVASTSSTGYWMTSASIVAICALLFTVASFWWLNARRGHLKTFEPHTFAATITPQLVRIRLPLLLHNTGAAPIIVQNLSVSFLGEQGSVSLPWVATRLQIKPDSNEPHAFPAVFSVDGRTTQQMFVEFGAPTLGFALEARDYRVRIDAKLGHKRARQGLTTFSFQAGQIVSPDSFITYENAPGSLSEERRQRARTALSKLANEISSRS